MSYKAFALCLGLLSGCTEIRQPAKESRGALPSFGVYTCKHCNNTDTVYFYWNLDTNTKRAQNIRAYGRK